MGINLVGHVMHIIALHKWSFEMQTPFEGDQKLDSRLWNF